MDREGEVEVADPVLGRRYVLAAAGLLVAVELAVLAGYTARLGTAHLPRLLIRLALLLALCAALLRGHTWARWLTVVLLAGGMWVVAGPLIRPGAFARVNLPGTLAMLGLFVSYGVVVRGMIWSRSVRAFFRSRRAGGAPPAPAS